MVVVPNKKASFIVIISNDSFDKLSMFSFNQLLSAIGATISILRTNASAAAVLSAIRQSINMS